MKLLIIEDDDGLGQALVAAFVRAGISVELRRTAAAAEDMLGLYHFDLAIVDRGLPDADGLDFVRGLRRKGNALPVIVLTAQSDAHARISGLDAGADDYLGKPFLFAELRARIEAVLRRADARLDSTSRCGNLAYNLVSHAASVAGNAIELTPREHRILEVLLRSGERPVSLGRLEDELCDPSQTLSVNALEVSVHRLRKKLLRHGCDAEVQAMRGFGYCIRHVA